MVKTVYVVAHSHWDHEWYFTQEDSDIILVENLDFLITSLEQDPEFTCYSFDGQFSIVEKYLRIRPENKGRIQKLIENKRLFVGPWYTQADVLLGKTESVIRNLLYGVKYSEDFGHSMNIGYAPDIFGQHAYLPSIYKRFGIEYSIFQRGVYNRQVEKNVNFLWEAPNKETIKTNNIFYGYGPGKFLSAEKEYVEDRLMPIIDSLVEKNQATDTILLPSGGDQVLINHEFPETVEKLNQLESDYHFLLSDYESFMEAAWKDQVFPDKISGELLACQKSRIHNTCRSERYDIKYLNYLVEDLLINELEPLCVMGKQHGINFPQNWLDQIWKKVFDSQAHNGIGASNSDDANHDIVVRMTSALRQIKDLINLVKKQLTAAISSKLNHDQIIVLFNTNIRKDHYSGELSLFTNTEDFSLTTTTGAAIQFAMISQEELDGGKKVIVTSKGEKEVSVPAYFRSVILIEDTLVPAMGYKTLLIEEKSGLRTNTINSKENIIENEFYEIDCSNGVTFYNKKTGETITDAFHFDDTADAGDSFDYSPLSGDNPIRINECHLVNVQKNSVQEVMILKHMTQLPEELVADRRSEVLKDFVVETTFTLEKGRDFIQVHHRIDNKINDHRVRVNWKNNVNDLSHHYGDQGYSLQKRLSHNPHEKTWREEGFVEKPMPIYPLENMIVLSDESSHFALHTGMMKEYQVDPETKRLSVTLFRSNGLLGRDDLAWRPGRASGINNMIVYTPDGQMQQQMEFDYFISFGNGSINLPELFKKADDYSTYHDYYQLQALNSYQNRIDRFSIPSLDNEVPAEYSMVEITNENIFISSCKEGWENGMILRLFNPTDQDQAIEIAETFAKKIIEIVDLKENSVGTFTQGHILAAKDFITLKIS